jgi:hypothetical protein
MPGDFTQLSFITLFFGVVIFILVMFLPAFLELRKPKDAGPRRIEEKVVSSKYQVQLASIERSEDTKADLAVIKKVANILSVLPNLEP